MQRLTVMYIWNDLTMGGATQSLIDTLSKMKDRVNCIVVIREKNQIVEYLERLNIKYYVYPFLYDYALLDERTKQKADMCFEANFEAAMQLREVILKEKVSMIHINSSSSSMGAMAALGAGIPYIWHIREFLREDFGCDFLDVTLMKELFARAQKLIAISDCVKDKYQERYELQAMRLYNGLDINRYKKKIENKKYNQKFLLAGVISEGKGQWDAVRAVELLVNQGYLEVELYIIGDGDENLRWIIEKFVVKKGLDKNIHIVSFQNDLAEYRKEVSYSITSSRMEALGRTTIEAMLAGNIVIGADTGGTKEIIGEDEQRGYLYKQGDYVDLAYVMQKAMRDNGDKKNEMLRRAQQYAELNFDSEQYCDKLYQVYEAVVKDYNLNDNLIFVKMLTDRYMVIKQKGISTCTEKELELKAQLKKTQLAYYWTMKWLQLEQKGFSIREYLKKNSIGTVAIYGMAQLGCRVYDELEKTQIKVQYVMDRNNKEISKVIEMMDPDDDLPQVDAIIVTVLSQQKELVQWLRKKCNYRILSLTQIISEVLC